MAEQHPTTTTSTHPPLSTAHADKATEEKKEAPGPNACQHCGAEAFALKRTGNDLTATCGKCGAVYSLHVNASVSMQEAGH